MDYSAKANEISSSASKVDLSGLDSSTLDGIWNGSAHDSLTTKFSESVKVLKEQVELASNFAKTLNKVQEYKVNKEKLNGLYVDLASIPLSEENAEARTKLSDEIKGIADINRNLKNEIYSEISGISSISSQLEAITYKALDDSGYLNSVSDLSSLLALYNNGQLTKLSDSGNGSSLYDYYSKEDIASKLEECKKNTNGRNASVNCVIGIMQMAAEVGVKLDYDWGGGHNTGATTLDDIANGVDCSAFASWAINQGAPNGFSTQTTSGLINVGKQINYENVQPGDILVKDNNGSGHAIFVLANDPNTKQFVLAEARGSSDGVVLSTQGYDTLINQYEARDLTDIYNG